MTVAVSSIVDAATKEWKFWGSASWNRILAKKSKGFHTDDEAEYAQYVVDTYCPIVYGKNFLYPEKDHVANDDFYWSAVTISYIMRAAGFAPSEFPVSDAHSVYIRWAIKARREKDKTATYWGFRVDEAGAKPEVGDLIGYVRDGELTPKQVLAYFDRTKHYPGHADIVVATRPGEIDVIGGNVLDSVTKKTLQIGANGLLADKNNDWFVVMKRRQV